MPFDLHITIPEDSPAGQVVQRLMIEEHVTPEQAVTRILTEAAGQDSPRAPGAQMAELDEAMARVRGEHRTYASFLGVVKGRPGAHGSKEAVDRYIAELRNE